MKIKKVKINFREMFKEDVLTTSKRVETTSNEMGFDRKTIVFVKFDRHMNSDEILDIAEKKLKYEMDDWTLLILNKTLLN